MPISHYPRRQQPITPTLLAPFLRRRKRLGIRLWELDASCWERYGETVCDKLAKAVVQELSRRVADILQTCGSARISAVEVPLTADDLELEVRTYNCLSRLAGKRSLGSLRLSELTIRDVLELPAFGIKSLVDLLTSVEATAGTPGSELSTTAKEPASAADLRHRGGDATWAEQYAETRRQCNEILNALCAIPGILEIERGDPRLGKWLRKLDVHAETICELCKMSPKISSGRALEALHSLQTDIQRFARLSVEEELISIVVGNNAASRNKVIVAEYYGFSRPDPVTLQAVAEKYNVTRERIRQICAPPKISRSPYAPYAPALDSALAMISANLPESSTKLEAMLFSEGFIHEGTGLGTVQRIARFLGRTSEFDCIGTRPSMFAVQSGQQREFVGMRRAARKLASKFGAALMDDVFAQCKADIGDPRIKRLVTAAVSSMDGFAWLDEVAGWFWFQTGKFSRLRRRIVKVLSVCNGLPVTELRSALRRDYHLRGGVPPTPILLEICRQIRGVDVNGDEIVANADLLRTGLRGDEAVLVGLLQQHGPLCRTYDLRELADREGVSRPSFWRCLSFCPTITRYAEGIFGLTGAVIAPGAVEALISMRPRVVLVKDHGWTADGKIWIAYRVSRNVVETGVVSVPAAKAPLLQGQFALTSSVVGSGQLTVKQASCWGIGPFLRRTHSEEGDRLVLAFDVRGRTVSASIGDDSLVEQLQDNDDRV